MARTDKMTAFSTRKRLGAALVSALALCALAACSSTPAPGETGAAATPIAFAPARIERPDEAPRGRLAGRTLHVNSIGDIRLASKEVILTFDDGPAGNNTKRILDALDRKGVKATFLMVGSMARNNPALAREVVRRGHSVGSHTYGHPNLARMSFDSAVKEIRRGEAAIRGAGIGDIPFFRFPYLADTGALRKHLAGRGIVVLDVDIDSKDYFKQSPQVIAERTMARVKARGRGIILMHDLHARTAAMVPDLLDRLEREGFKVVALKPARAGPFVAAAN